MPFSKMYYIFRTFNISSVEKFCLNIFPMIHPCMSWIFLMSSILSTPTSIQVVNEWEVFESMFKKAFPSANPPFHRTVVINRLWRFLGFLMTILMVVKTSNISGSSCKFLERIPVNKDIRLIICTAFGNFTFFTATHSFFEDAKFIIMLTAISVALRQVCLKTLQNLKLIKSLSLIHISVIFKFRCFFKSKWNTHHQIVEILNDC